jgi:hypothetical protein
LEDIKYQLAPLAEPKLREQQRILEVATDLSAASDQVTGCLHGLRPLGSKAFKSRQ